MVGRGYRQAEVAERLGVSVRTVKRRLAEPSGKPHEDGGRSGIRTHEPLAGLAVFKTVAFVRSAILPATL